MNRRHFIRITGLAALSTFALGTFQLAKTYASELKLIDMSGKKRKDKVNQTAVKQAQGIGYVEDLEAALKAKKVKKTDQPGFKASEQTCLTCQFYKETEKGVAGTCTLIPKVLVHSEGSCNTWVRKA